jgi:phosphatidylglycerophosphatase A
MNAPTPPTLSASVDPVAIATGGSIAAPSLRFMLAHPAHGVALGFGSGLLRPAPGTWGTLAGWGAFIALDGWLSPVAWAVVIAVTFLLGCASAQRTGAALGRPDHGAIVIDEIVAIWIVLLMLPSTLIAQAGGFLVFRLFDILKPPPIRALDRRWKNGVGVMVDDLVAAFYTVVLAAIVVRVLA